MLRKAFCFRVQILKFYMGIGDDCHYYYVSVATAEHELLNNF